MRSIFLFLCGAPLIFHFLNEHSHFQVSALECYFASQINVSAAFGGHLKEKTVNSSHVCGIQMKFDHGAMDVAEINIFYKKSYKKGNSSAEMECWKIFRRQERSGYEVQMNVSAYGTTTVSCECRQNLCNTPETIMDHLDEMDTIKEILEEEFEKREEEWDMDNDVTLIFWTFLFCGPALLIVLATIVVAIWIHFKYGLKTEDIERESAEQEEEEYEEVDEDDD